MALPTVEPAAPRPLRLWPGVLTAALVVVLRFLAPAVAPEALMVGVIAGAAGALLILLWWLLLSRAPWSERLLALGVAAAAVAATWPLLHVSIRTGMMGMMFGVYAAPVVAVAFVGWAVASRRLRRGPRRVAMAATVVLACAAFALLRTEGVTGEGDSDFEWRWTATAEERLLARAADTPAPPSAPTAASPSLPAPTPAASASALPRRPAPVATPTPAAAAAWPGFRGAGRDGVARGLRVATDWSAAPPAELWRQPIGPGWSSFAVEGDRLYTQEQRGDRELVSCYELASGRPVWRHEDPVRFYESNGGAGPRGTPTLSGGRVYALGATGILNALEADGGAVAWSRELSSDADRKVPTWGFASSPLVVDGLVVVAAAGQLVAYAAGDGAPRWLGPKGGSGYSSPHLATIDGVPQVLLLSGSGAVSVAPADGRLLWEHRWPGDGIVQPALTGDGVLLGSGSGLGADAGVGLRRLALGRGPGAWTAEERWTSTGLKPYYNDFVVHRGHAFGFDGSILACVDLRDGQRRWKGGRYGHGQLLLLADQDALLVLSEDGEIALVAATPEGYRELGRMPAIEGKTWNHPVVAGDVLLVRNGQEMAAFRLPAAP